MRLNQIADWARRLALIIIFFSGALSLVAAAGASALDRYSIQHEREYGVDYVVLRDTSAGIEAAIAPDCGGELAGLRVRRNQLWNELLYRARDYRAAPGWRGKAPILWPAVGRNFSRSQAPDSKAESCSYDLDGKRYEIPIHGFARFRSWRIVEQKSDGDEARLELEMVDDAASRAQYPFGFRFCLIYRIVDGALTIEHRILASPSNRAPMLFSAGNHLTFRVPLLAGSTLDAMTFNTPSQVELLKDANSIPTGAKCPKSFREPAKLIQEAFVPARALAEYSGPAEFTLRDGAGTSVTIRHHASRYPATPFVQFNLWGSLTDGYFCPEPWIGMVNSLNRHEGLIELSAGEEWSWSIQITVESF